MLKNIFYSVAFLLCLYALGWIALFAIIPIAFIMLIFDKHKPSNKHIK